MSLGLEMAGMTCAGQVEIDDYCNRVLEKHWPDVPRWRDVKNINPTELPTVELICGGYPCQPLVSPGTEEARKMTATSGRLFFPLLPKSGPLGACLRTLLGMSRWSSTMCFLTWKISATPARRSLFRLVPSVPHTEETGYGLLPTPCAQDHKTFLNKMSTVVNYMASGHQVHLVSVFQRKGYTDNQIVEKYEEVMGFPTGWTELNHAEMRLCRMCHLK